MASYSTPSHRISAVIYNAWRSIALTLAAYLPHSWHGVLYHSLSHDTCSISNLYLSTEFGTRLPSRAASADPDSMLCRDIRLECFTQFYTHWSLAPNMQVATDAPDSGYGGYCVCCSHGLHHLGHTLAAVMHPIPL